MPSENLYGPEPDQPEPRPLVAFDVLDSRIRYLLAELDAVDEIIAGAQGLLALNEQGRLSFCTQMAKLALDELAARALGERS